MDWYKTLDIDKKINLKECCFMLCGFNFSDLNFMFSLNEKIDIVYNKLKLEGFDV